MDATALATYRSTIDEVPIRVREAAIFLGVSPQTVYLCRILNVAVRKKLLPSNPCAGVEFPVAVKSLFRPHYMSWSEQQRIEFSAPDCLRNVIRIMTETGLRIYKELIPMKKDQIDLENRTVWIPDPKAPNGVAEVPLTEIAVEAFRSQLAIAGPGPYLFRSDRKPNAHQRSFTKVWHSGCDGRESRISESTICILPTLRGSAPVGVADEW